MAWEYNKTNFDRNLAVVIGIDCYENHPQIHRLRTPVNDARALADLLETEYEYKPENVIRLLDEAATLTGLQTLLNDTLPNQLKPTKGDRLIFYFAGHGIPRNSEDGPKGYLVPQDADWQKEGSFLAMSEVYEALKKLDCHHLLVILDCCFAGTFRWAGRRKIIPILETVRREHYDRFIRYPAWQVITSAAHDQEALDVAKLADPKRDRDAIPDEKQVLHSPFALALLEGLRENKADMIPDGVITAHELYVYLEQQVSQLSGERQKPGIYPMRLEYDRGEFVFTKPGFTSEQLKPAPLLNESNNPYRGLASFDEKHANFFFGRKILVEELQHRLSQANRFLTVVLGASGSGKSSLVKAGLIPELRQESKWYILDPIRPDRYPFTALARAIVPIEKPELIEQLSQVSFLDEVFKPKEESGQDQGEESTDTVFVKLAESWNSAKSEAKLLVVEDYFKQLLALCRNPQEKEQLSQLYRAIFEQLESLSNRLQNSRQHLTRVIRKWSETHLDVKLLLTIDQFEELITMSQESQTETHGGDRQQSDRAAESQPWLPFLQVLLGAIVECPQQLHIVLTLRSDFEPRFLSSPLSAYWKDARFPVRAMNLDELRQAIEGPALKQALYFEPPELVGMLIDEVGQMPGALPLLSFTLSELYIKLYDRWTKDNATDRALRIKDYEELGGVAGALTRRATQEYDNLVRDFGEAPGKAYQATMRRVMLRMVAIEGVGIARRRVPESELVYPDAEENKRVAQVSDRLIKTRLLVTGQEAGVSYVEPAHDFLVREWDKLQQWIKNEKEELTLQQRLTVAANEWESKNQQEARRKRLRDIWRQAETAIIQKIQERKFARERLKQQEAEAAKGREESSTRYLWDDDPRLGQLKQILIINNWFNQIEDEFVRESLVEKKRNAYRLTGIVTGVVIVLIGLTLAALYQAKLSRLREEVAVSKTLVSTDPPKALAFAIQATDQASKPFFNSVLSSAKSSLFSVLEASRELNILRRHEGAVTKVAFSPNSQVIVSGGQDGTVRLWNLQGKYPIVSNLVGRHEGGVTALAFSPTDNNTLVSGGKDGTVRRWNLQGKSAIFGKHEGGVTALAFSPTDSNTFVSVGRDGIVRLWNLNKTSKILGNIRDISKEGRRAVILSVAFSPDGKTIATGGSGHLLRLWNLEQKTAPKELPFNNNSDKESEDNGGIGCITSIAFNPDGNDIIAGRALQSNPYRETLAIWHSWRYNYLQNIHTKAHEFSTYAVASNPRGNIFVTAGDNDTLEIHDLLSGELVAPRLVGHAKVGWAQCANFYGNTNNEYGSITSVAFSPNGELIASAGADGTVRIWSTESFPGIKSVQVTQKEEFHRAIKVQVSLYENLVTPSRFFRTDGSSIVIRSQGNTLELEEVKDSPKGVYPAYDDIFYSPNGQSIAVVKQKKIIQIQSVNGNQISQINYSKIIKNIALSNSSKKIAIVTNNNEIEVRDYQGNQLGLPFLHEGNVDAIALSPDGQTLVTATSVGFLQGGGDSVIRLWDIEGNPIAKFNQPGALFNTCGNSCSFLAFSPSGKSIISYSYIYNPSLKIFPGNWQVLLGVACSRLQKHPILNPSMDDIAKEAKTICKRKFN
ncbi:nSTAND1 domain-containing NTPase [Microcoleus sp. OTE_8_concoct_300]|uniref:nSTAND1 domain-containing NTPase n=1 Tax=Microcoleus sp. OTE_8_concoct_300 TaxID=2964710 RepID=UPI00403F954A